MDSQARARLDELIERLDALERKVDGLEGRLTRLSSPPAAPPQPAGHLPASPHPRAPEPAEATAAMATTPSDAFDPYISDPYASPRARQQWPAPPPAAPSTPARAPTEAYAAPQREGNVASYLLSGAAALLVLLAAVSLIALVWEQIPDSWKVGGLGLLSLGMTSAGTSLAESRPRQQVAAATITGTGGALGFVTIIGAVLLMDLPAPVALVLMAAWGFVLLLVSWTAQQFFTAVVSTLGALVTIGFACVQAGADPGQAALAWTLVGGYLIALAAVCALLPHYSPGMHLAAWLPTTSMVVTATALVIGPADLLSAGSPIGVTLLCLPAVVLLVQAHHSGRLLSRAAGRYAAAWEWAGVGVALVLAVLRFGLHPAAAAGTGSLTAVVLLTAVVVSTAALLPDGGETPWPHNVVGVNLGALAGVGAAAVAVDPRLLLPAVLALAPASAPLVRGGRSAPVAVLPSTGLAAFALASRAQPARDTVALVLVAVVAAIGLGLWLESRLADPPDSLPARTLRLHTGLLTAAAWLMTADLVVVLPWLLRLLAPDTVAAPLWAGACALAVSGLGLFTQGCTPLKLVSGARAGALEGAGGPRTPLVRQVPVIARIGFGLLALQAAAILAEADYRAHSAGGVPAAAPLVVLGLALTVAGARLLLPWLERTGAALAIAILQSAALWWSALILTGVPPTSMLVTALVLASGTVCIVIGFRARATALRHYGLILVMLVVVKLAVLDLADGNSITQILALLVAGLACFCLSLAYNRFAHEQARRARPGPTRAMPGPQNQPPPQ